MSVCCACVRPLSPVIVFSGISKHLNTFLAVSYNTVLRTFFHHRMHDQHTTQLQLFVCSLLVRVRFNPSIAVPYPHVCSAVTFWSISALSDLSLFGAFHAAAFHTLWRFFKGLLVIYSRAASNTRTNIIHNWALCVRRYMSFMRPRVRALPRTRVPVLQ